MKYLIGLVVLVTLAAWLATFGSIKAAVSAAGRAIEDKMPFEVQVDAAADRIEQLARQRHRLRISRENLAAQRGALAHQMDDARSQLRKQQGSVSRLTTVLDDMRTRDETERTIGGEVVQLSQLTAQRAELSRAVESLRESVASRESTLRATDDELSAMDRDIGELEAAEKEQRTALAKAVRDEELLQARLAAARARIEARGAVSPWDHGGAIQRHNDALRVDLAVALEKLPPAPPPAPANVEAIDREAKRIEAARAQ